MARFEWQCPECKAETLRSDEEAEVGKPCAKCAEQLAEVSSRTKRK